MRTLLAPIALISILTLAPASAAEECFDYGVVGTGVWQFTGGTADTTFYVDDHDFALGNGIWILEETNGVWEDKLPGVYRAAHWWSQPDMQFTDCSVIVPSDCNVHWCPEFQEYAWGPDTLIL